MKILRGDCKMDGERTKQETPGAAGYRMPAEFERHRGCLMIWPQRPGSWPYGAENAKKVFAEIAGILSRSEQVTMLVSQALYEEAERMLSPKVNLLKMESDDAWARDTGPTFVVSGTDETAYEERKLAGINWEFNAWGGNYDGLYANWKKDNEIAASVLQEMNCRMFDAAPFVLEGGSIHTDGQGTMLVTENCLLSPGRNPGLSRQQIEEKLKEYCGAEKIIWLPCGIYQDETNEHVDNVCAFTAPGEVVLAWTDDRKDPQYAMSQACLQVLERETDARGRKFLVRKLLIPETPVCITEQELNGLQFEEGEDIREAGERLAASYVNFYIANDAVLVPQFGDAHDKLACLTLQEAFPARTIEPIFARDIIVGGGNIHCITQQIPLAGKGVEDS
ncbi:MAG: agmatine deiminase [Candidatus Gastranaerophilaceae bacterium]